MCTGHEETAIADLQTTIAPLLEVGDSLQHTQFSTWAVRRTHMFPAVAAGVARAASMVQRADPRALPASPERGWGQGTADAQADTAVVGPHPTHTCLQGFDKCRVG